MNTNISDRCPAKTIPAFPVYALCKTSTIVLQPAQRENKRIISTDVHNTDDVISMDVHDTDDAIIKTMPFNRVNGYLLCFIVIFGCVV